MPGRFSPITKQAWLLTIKAIDSPWETFSGLDDKVSTSDYSDGLSNRIFKLHGPRTLENFTFTKAFDPIKDKPIVKYWKDFCQSENKSTTASIVPVKYCPRVEPMGPALILFGVVPVSFKGFEVDKKSSDVSTLELVISAEDWSYE